METHELSRAVSPNETGEETNSVELRKNVKFYREFPDLESGLSAFAKAAKVGSGYHPEEIAKALEDRQDKKFDSVEGLLTFLRETYAAAKDRHIKRGGKGPSPEGVRLIFSPANDFVQLIWGTSLNSGKITLNCWPCNKIEALNRSDLSIVYPKKSESSTLSERLKAAGIDKDDPDSKDIF